MNIKNVTTAILALTAAMSHADLLDQKEWIDKQYGAPILQDGAVHKYRWRDYIVEIKYWRHELFGTLVKSQKIYREDLGKITMRDIQVILPSRLHGGAWEQDGHHWYKGRQKAWLLKNEIIFSL